MFNILLSAADTKSKMVAEVMAPCFPFVSPEASMEEVSKLITKENAAVLLKDLMGDVHIITRQDLIEAIA
jgi:cystathionine beta-synthase